MCLGGFTRPSQNIMERVNKKVGIYLRGCKITKKQPKDSKSAVLKLYENKGAFNGCEGMYKW